mgnify:CR=1 FL=1
MNDEGRFQGGDQVHRDFGPSGLLAPRFEFEGTIAGVEHVMGISDDDEFELGGREEGRIEHGEGKTHRRFKIRRLSLFL